MIKLSEITLLKIMPQFLRNVKKITYISNAITTVLIEVLDKFKNMKRMQKISTGDLTEEEIEYILWEKHVDYFDKTLTSAQKIELIQNSEQAHLKKGTRAVLEKHLKIIFGDLELQEWFEAGLDPYHFQVLSNHEISDDVLRRVNRTVNEFKTVRSVFDGFYAIEIIDIPYKNVIAIEELSEETFEILLEVEVIKDYQKIGIIDLSIEIM